MNKRIYDLLDKYNIVKKLFLKLFIHKDNYTMSYTVPI